MVHDQPTNRPSATARSAKRWQARPEEQPRPQIGEIHVILGGFAGGGESGSLRRAYARRLRSFETMAIDKLSKAGRMGEQPISFSESDAEGYNNLTMTIW